MIKMNDSRATALIYNHPNYTNVCGMFDKEGLLQQYPQGLNDTIKGEIISKVNEQMGIQIETFELVDSPVNVGEKLPNWDKYKKL